MQDPCDHPLRGYPSTAQEDISAAELYPNLELYPPESRGRIAREHIDDESDPSRQLGTAALPSVRSVRDRARVSPRPAPGVGGVDTGNPQRERRLLRGADQGRYRGNRSRLRR